MIVGTESWLNPEISDSEVFPTGYTPFRRDRKSLKQCGGVFILARENFICTEQPEFGSNYELLWVRLQIAGSHPLYIGGYYKPKEDDLESLAQLRESLVLARKRRGNIWLLGILTCQGSYGLIILQHSSPIARVKRFMNIFLTL